MNIVCERGIIFTRASVEAIAAGYKTQTRRVVTWANCNIDGAGRSREMFARLDLDRALVDPGPSPAGNRGRYLKAPGPDGAVHRLYSQWQPGDWLYVKEARDGRSPIFMPKSAARLWLEVTAVRAERLHDISLADIRAESVDDEDGEMYGRWRELDGSGGDVGDIRERWRALWDSINARRGYPWASNPWVWAISFRRVER